MFSNNRETYRQVFIDAWRKAQTAQPISPLEGQIVDILRRHPHYQSLLDQGQDLVAQEYHPERGEANPFLHLGLHLAVIEQLSIDQPPGIRQQYQDLLQSLGDPHQVEHSIMACLTRELQTLQHQQQSFSEQRYLECLRQIGGARR